MWNPITRPPKKAGKVEIQVRYIKPNSGGPDVRKYQTLYCMGKWIKEHNEDLITGWREVC